MAQSSRSLRTAKRISGESAKRRASGFTSTREAVRCHFNEGQAPKLIRLHYVRDEVIAA
jgi:hypothetical protein